MHPFLYALRNRRLFDVEPVPPTPTPSAVPPIPPAMPTPPQQASFSREYVTELREEAKTYRLRADEAKREADAAKAAADAAKAEAEAAKTAAEQAANDRIIRAELKAEAAKAGMVDLDGLKLADLSSVTIGEDGSVTGATELLAKLKEGKPYLFGAPPAHSSQPNPPPPAPDKVPPSDVRKMTKEEYEAAKRKAVRGF